MKKIFVSLSILFAAVLLHSANAQNSAILPQGRWKVSQITIGKNTDGKTQTSVYKTAAEVQSYIRCPQEWEVKDTQNIVLEYSEGTKEPCTYTLEANRLTVHTPSGMQVYQYATNTKILTLITTYNYINNLSIGDVEHIMEQWTIILKKQSF